MKAPRNYQSTSTSQKLGSGPQDMPDRGGGKTNYETTSTRVGLSRNANPVANLQTGAKQGSYDSTSSTAKLSRNTNPPPNYGEINKTTPQVSFSGRKKR